MAQPIDQRETAARAAVKEILAGLLLPTAEKVPAEIAQINEAHGLSLAVSVRPTEDPTIVEFDTNVRYPQAPRRVRTFDLRYQPEHHGDTIAFYALYGDPNSPWPNSSTNPVFQTLVEANATDIAYRIAEISVGRRLPRPQPAEAPPARPAAVRPRRRAQ